MALKSVAEAAKELGFCEAQIRRMIKAGEWPYYKMSEKGIRLDPEEIKAITRVEAGRSDK